MRSLKNKNGMIMIMVLMIVIVLMMLSASILSTSLHQSTASQGQLDKIKAEQLIKGVYAREYGAAGFATRSTAFPIAGGKTYTVNSTVTAGGQIIYTAQ